MKRSPLLPIFLIVVVDVFGLTLMIPVMPFYAEHFGASAQQVTLLLSTYAFCQLFSGPLLGRISDRVGRKPLLLVSQIGTLIGFLVMGQAHTLWVLYLARVIDGATAGNLSLAQAYIADVTEPKDRSRAFGIIGIAFGMGFLIGPAIAGALGQFDLRYPVYLATALSFTSIMATTFLLPGGRPGRSEKPGEAEAGPVAPGGKRVSIIAWGSYVEYFRRPALGALLIQFALFIFAFYTFTSGFALFAERRLIWRDHMFTVREVSWVFAYSGLLGVLLQGGLIGRLVKRFGEMRLVTSGFLSAAIGYALLSITDRVPLLAVAATFSAYGTGMLRPVLTSLITQQVGRHEQGAVLGLNQSLQSVGQILAPLIAGALIQRHLLSVWAIEAALVLVAGFVISRLASTPRQVHSEPAAR